MREMPTNKQGDETSVMRTSNSVWASLYRSGRLILPAAFLAGSLTSCERPRPQVPVPGSEIQRGMPQMEATPARDLITPNGVYFGAFLDDTLSPAGVSRFNSLIGGNLDMVLQFHAFGKGFDFPSETVSVLRQKGIASLIKLEPWSWKGKSDNSFSLERLIAGKFDTGLAKFAAGLAAQKTPILLTFGHEMNGDWYPWAGHPELYKEAYIHVWETFERTGANKYATWLWNPNAGTDPSAYYPGDSYVDGIGLDGYSTDWTGNPADARALFGQDIGLMRQLYPEKPLWILETGYDKLNGGSAAGEAQFLKSLFELAVQDDLAGVFYFNTTKTETGCRRKWSITDGGTGCLREQFEKYSGSFSSSPMEPNSGASEPAAAIVPDMQSGADIKDLFLSQGAFGSARLRLEDGAIEISAPKGNYDAGGYFILDRAVMGTLAFDASKIKGEIMILFINDASGTDTVLADERVRQDGPVSLKIPEGTTKMCIHPALSGNLRLENFAVND